MAFNKETGLWEGYIYRITNRIDGLIYIGQTRRTIRQRFWDHCKSINRRSHTPSAINIAINNYGLEFFYIEEIEKVICETKEQLVQKLNELEIYYIGLYKSYNPNIGYNRTYGGDNTCIIPNCKLVDMFDIYGNYIKTYSSLTEAAKDNNLDISDISKCCKRQGTSYTIGGYKWAFHGELPWMSPKNIIKNRPVREFDTNGNMLRQYKCINDITNDLRLRNRIRNCCKGLIKTVNNKVYRYDLDTFNKYETRNKKWINNTPVDQLSIDGKYINSFPTIRDAQKQTGAKSISHVISGKAKTSGGYKWRYSERSFDDLQEIIDS